LFFGRVVTLIVLAVTMSGFGLIIAAEIMEILPFGPAFVEVPETMSQPGSALFSFQIGGILLIGTIIMGMSAYTFGQWHSREDQLERATAIIGRYIPRQLAERIVSGEYTLEDTYDRRTITIFFSDIVGFTETADQMEGETLSRILNEYLSEMSTIAERYGGTIDKFVGDAIMIFFGAPESLSNQEDALNAVRMAADMQRKMSEMATTWYEQGIAVPFAVRMGLNTGPASVGNFGSPQRMDYTAIGNEVNLAARIQSECSAGKILISHSTWGLVHDDIECTERGEVEVKGFHYPIKIYDVDPEASC